MFWAGERPGSAVVAVALTLRGMVMGTCPGERVLAPACPRTCEVRVVKASAYAPLRKAREILGNGERVLAPARPRTYEVRVEASAFAPLRSGK